MRLSCILIVEDEDYLREEIHGALTKQGYSVFSAPDGQAALKMLESATSPYLLLVDLLMPNMDGWELLEKVKKLAEARQLAHRALIISGSTAAAEIAHQEGAGFLAKPFTFEQLLAKVSQY